MECMADTSAQKFYKTPTYASLSAKACMMVNADVHGQGSEGLL